MPFELPRRGAALVAILLIPATALWPASAAAEEALLAVAANFAGAAESIAAAFAGETEHAVRVTTGSTGKLYAQISEGAPFDILLSADAKTPKRLEAEGLGLPGSRFTYAVGRLSLWSADADRDLADPKAALTDPDTLFIAIANPELAPYGAAAREAMRALGVWEAVQPKIVMGQNIGQTFSMVDSGAAQLGFIATSALQGPGIEQRGARLDIRQELFAPIEQDAILLKMGEDNLAAIAFMEFLKGEKAREIARSFGYGTD